MSHVYHVVWNVHTLGAQFQPHRDLAHVCFANILDLPLPYLTDIPNLFTPFMLLLRLLALMRIPFDKHKPLLVEMWTPSFKSHSC